MRGATSDLSEKQDGELSEEIEKRRRFFLVTRNYEMYMANAFDLGTAIAWANYYAGENAQMRNAEPGPGEVDIRIPADHLRHVLRMADYGFRRMLNNSLQEPINVKEGYEWFEQRMADSEKHTWSFQNEDEAHTASRHIEN